MNRLTKVQIEADSDDCVEVKPKSIAGLNSRDNDDVQTNENDYQSQYDAIGVALLGTKGDRKTLIYYNRHNNTYTMNFNAGQVPEPVIVSCDWDMLTVPGSAKVRNLRRFYEEKMPDRLKDLLKKVREGKAPDIETLTKFNMTGPGQVPILENYWLESYSDLKQDTMLDYDLDFLHAASAQEDCVEVAYSGGPIAGNEPTTGQGFTLADLSFNTKNPYNMLHSLCEAALTSVGFSLSLISENHSKKIYNVSLNGNVLAAYSMDDMGSIQSISDLLEATMRSIGWYTQYERFPLNIGNGSLSWSMNSSDGRLGLVIDRGTSQAVFTVLNSRL